MAWTTPKTNWMPFDMATAEDMNRIFNNVRWLKSHSDYEKTFIENDIVTLKEWEEMTGDLIQIAMAEELDFSEPDSRSTYDNLNNVEDILARAKGQNDARWNMYLYNHFSGQGFTSGYQIYCGGHERDLYGYIINMRKYNHYAGSYRLGSGIYSGGYL